MDQRDEQLDEINPISGGNARNSRMISDDEDPSLLVRTEVRPGRLPGNERVRLVRPSQPSFRRISNGLLEATNIVEKPHSNFDRVKRFLIGAPIASSRAEFERLTKFKALAVLSSDAISSVAYATEAILITLIAAGSGNLWVTLPISIAIVALLSIVAISYRQTIPAYPNGGGSYIVAKDNLGTMAGLVAAASLLIDYVLTVSVSISSGVQNLASLFTSTVPTVYIVTIDVVLVIIVTIVNLRGVRESGSIFSIPTYIFIFSALFLIIVGCVKSFFIQHNPVIGHFTYVAATEPLNLFLILKSFAAGCSAMTGVEAISNGVPAFKKPEARNASMTLTWMAVILGTLFIGITILAMSYHVEANPAGNPTVIAQIAAQVFNGPLFFMYPVFQIATLLILTLAANTSYSDFPRLASLLARDKFLPHQFAFRGDRLAFSIGITFLAILAGLLLILFQGNTTQLINLYAVGVFMSFTLSQSGMVRHWWRLRNEHKGWQRSLFINGLGAFTTLLVAVVISFTKFLEGAWIVVILIPLLVMMFLGIHRHYARVEHQRTTDIPLHPRDIHHRLIVPIAGLDRVSVQSLAYARSISRHVTAVHIAIDAQDAEVVREAWDRWQKHLSEEEETHLIVIESPYRSLSRPLLAYIDTVHELFPDDTLTVILPEFVVAHWWEHILHNQTALRLKGALLFRPGIVVTSVPQHLRERVQ
ncbi:MAG TPA: APC family permease [Ktedonobacteraceae bacterium]|nr:APC family permease [Ktedonobacteraceae bacterium]